MIIELLIYFSQARKEICICNKECTHLCPAIYFNASSSFSFRNFISPYIKDEKEIDFYLYSQNNGFTFSIDLSYFHYQKLTLKALIDSKEILLYIKKENHENYTKTKIKPGYKINLPDLTMTPDLNSNTNKYISSSNSPSSTTIPISLGLHQLYHTGDTECENGPQSDSSRNKKYKLSSYGTSTSNSNCRCPNEDGNLDQPSAYKCGHRCYGATTYRHTFKGVQFAIYGTKDSSDARCYVKIDDKPEEEVNLFSNVRLDYTIIYTSDVLEYKEHTIIISPKNGGKYEINKFVYWPSITAKRLNCTEFVLNPEGGDANQKWKTESDGIGGVRKYRDVNGAALFKLQCTKFWIYGLIDKNYPNLNVNYNGKSDSVPTKATDEIRRENVLIYESPEFEYSSITVNLKPSSNVLIIYCVFYEVPPSPVPTPIPMSVNLKEMECKNIGSCVYSAQSISVEYNKGDHNHGCSTDYAASYQCGIRCQGTRMEVSYTFKGVKFGLFGKYNPNFGTINVKLDGNNIANINANGPEFLYANLFESDVYIYKDHTVTITSTGVYEIYKLVFWPTIKANRCNSTEFSYPKGVRTSSDKIGGVTKWYDYYDLKPKYYEKKNFQCSRFWIYIISDKNYKFATLTYDGKSYQVNQETPTRNDCSLVFVSDEFEYKSIDLKGASDGYLTLYCVYYHAEPSEFEYIDKNFYITLPYIQIYVPPISKINQISGCNFSHISEELDYFIILEKDVEFFDNTFEYSSTNNVKYAMPIRVQYNSQGSSFLIIRNCTFTQATRKASTDNANVFYCNSSYSINVDFQSCLFDNCGSSSSEIIIQIESSNSFVKMENCTFQFTQNSCKVLKTSCSRATFNECKFIKSGPIIFEQEEGSSSTEESNNIAITRCTFDSCSISSYNYECIKMIIQSTSSLTFEHNMVCNMNTIEIYDYLIFIDGNDKIDQIDFKNISFVNNTSKSLYGGGCGMMIFNINKLIFTSCDFINNEARKNHNQARNNDMIIPGGLYYNGDGGAIQIGFHCWSNKAALTFESCTFKKNRAVRHGGALAIQTLTTVNINNCMFESNEANYNFESSAELLIENHFNKKTQGRAGAIYINPSYFYNAQYPGCENIDDYLKKISITNCQFLSNSAFDGYAIYVEGDEVPTEFVITENVFDRNYNYDEESANNDPNISARAVIASEIFAVPEKNTITQNDFLNLTSKKFIFVDHYGSWISNTPIFTETEAFTKTEGFTLTADFTTSKKFTNSGMFSDSNEFSKSSVFSNSEKFTETGSFTKTEGFTATTEFTTSEKFTNSCIFSDSKEFSKSFAFSNSEKFTETELFSKTEEFTLTADFSVSEKFTNSGMFSDSKEFSKSSMFSNSEKFTETGSFTKTEGFTATTEFTTSEKFTNSGMFSDSKEFSKSLIFSNSAKFTETGSFTKTEGFTITADFTTSEKFSFSGSFSDSTKFSISNAFSNTEKFSLTEAFTHTVKFSYSISFTESERFSTSLFFSNSNKFSFSNQFTNTNKFSATTSFTNSKKFSESFYFSQSNDFSPSIPFFPKAQCALYINGEYKQINNCEYSQYESTNVLIQVLTTNFTDYQKDGDGSAIHLSNCGLIVNSSHFIDCISTSPVGGGGAIYINNSMNIENNVTFIDVLFLRCKAAYGGAVFLYSNSDININYFLRCKFLSNEAYAKKSVSNENKNLYGGGAIYATTQSLLVENCSFHHNKGSGVKICNLLNEEKSKHLLEKSVSSFYIIGCEFEKDVKSKSSISYVDQSIGNKLEIKNCEFKGKIKKGSHYIEGMLLEKESILMESCNFEDDANNIMNLIFTNDLAFEMNPKFMLNPILNKYWIIILGTVLIIALFSIISWKISAFRNMDGSDEKPFEP